MEFKCILPKDLIEKVIHLEEFANGGTQVTVRLFDGTNYEKVLISNKMYIVAMRGHNDLPFKISDIAEIFQVEEDKNPSKRGGWEYWDDWLV